MQWLPPCVTATILISGAIDNIINHVAVYISASCLVGYKLHAVELILSRLYKYKTLIFL